MFIIYFIWRCLDFFVAFLADFFVHSSGNYQLHLSPKDNPFHIAQFILNSGNFDGYNYLFIAQNGYGGFEQTFFPLFPLLIHVVSYIFAGNYFTSGFVITNLSFFVGLLFFRKYLSLIGKNPSERTWILLFLLTFPTSFFFGAVYTESLFFLLVTGTLYFAEKKSYGKLIIFAILAALTRLMGIFLIIPLFAIIFLEQTQLRLIQKKITQKISSLAMFLLHHYKLLAIVLSPLAGLALYILYLQITQHDGLLFYHAQSNFLSGRSSHSIILLPQVYYRYMQIFIHATHDLIYFVAVMECLSFTLVFGILLYDLWMLWKNKKETGRMDLIGLNLFSLINILLPTLTGTFLSVPRFSLLSLSFFIRLGVLPNKPLKIALLILFSLLQIILLSLFSQGYFVS